MDLSHIQFQGKPAKVGKGTDHRPPSCGPTVATSRTDQQAEGASGIPAFVLAESGLNPAAYRGRPLERRVGACLRVLRTDVAEPAMTRVSTDPAMRAIALSTLLIGVSSFFRDSEVFSTIRSAVVPALRERSCSLRVLSVGCSMGAELYSVAMMLAEANLLAPAHMLGIDCRADAVDAARAGIFSTDAVADVGAERQSRFFDRTDAGWRIVMPLRRAISWQVADATGRIPEGPWDLVLCRNLVMYLQSAVAEDMFRQIAAGLSPDGFLVVGRAERPPAFLRLVTVGRSVYRNHGSR